MGGRGEERVAAGVGKWRTGGKRLQTLPCACANPQSGVGGPGEQIRFSGD